MSAPSRVHHLWDTPSGDLSKLRETISEAPINPNIRLYELCHASEIQEELRSSANGHSSQRNIINLESLHSPDLARRTRSSPTHHAASRVYEHRHPLSEVGDLKEHHVGGGAKFMGRAFDLRETLMSRDLVDKLHRCAHLCPDVVMANAMTRSRSGERKHGVSEVHSLF